MLNPQFLHTAKKANLQADPVGPGLTQRQTLHEKFNHMADSLVQATGLKSRWKANEKAKVCLLTISPAGVCSPLHGTALELWFETPCHCRAMLRCLHNAWKRAGSPSSIRIIMLPPFSFWAFHSPAYHTHDLHAFSLTFYHKTVECLSFISTHGFLKFLH